MREQLYFPFVRFLSVVLLGSLLISCRKGNIDENWCDHPPRREFEDFVKVPVRDSWFEVYLVADEVYAICEPHQFQEVISYLITGQEKALLFDTGMGIGKIRVVAEKLTDLPVIVLNSHTHFDHVGGNYEFDTILGFDFEYTERNSAGRSNKDLRSEFGKDALCWDRVNTDVTPENYSIRPFKITRFVGDGEVIELGNRTLEIIHIPGHTPDAIALIDRDNRELWCGDTYYDGPIYLYSAETDLEAFNLSLERLGELADDVDLVFPGHNVPKAQAAVLKEYHMAFKELLNKKPDPVRSDRGISQYRVGEFTFLLTASDLQE